VAKLIVTGRDRTQALERSRRALKEFVVEGMPSAIPFHAAVVSDPAFVGADGFQVHTRWIETEFDNQIPPYAGPVDVAEADERETVTVEVGGKRLEVVLPAGLGASAAATGTAKKKPSRRAGSSGKGAAASGDSLTSPMQGTIVKIAVEEGATVAEGDLIVVLEAMKMEQPLNAHKAGTVTGLSAAVGATVAAGAAICEIKD
jgi:acetyl-CoA/propionyl-CoA carboxylase biotin carboxyl carrier protein